MNARSFLDGYIWGSVSTADITVAGEKASAAAGARRYPVDSVARAAKQLCQPKSSGGTGNEGDSLMAFGANGILGVGLFQQDCGPACTTQNTQIQNVYYDCPVSGCTPTSVALAQQVSNPVIFFTSDNNGVLIQLPAVPNGGSPTVNGSLIFGIGTQSNNGLGSATVYPVPDSGNNVEISSPRSTDKPIPRASSTLAPMEFSSSTARPPEYRCAWCKLPGIVQPPRQTTCRQRIRART